MTYSQSSRVVHLNNIADTAKNLVRSGRSLGRKWDLRMLPVGRGNPARVVTSRLVDLAQWEVDRRRPDLLHVHYAPNAYYAWVRRLPHVVHVHGTDLRQDLHRKGMGRLVREALLRADAVIAATPDLLEPLQAIREDALHLPNPVTLELVTRTPTPVAATGKVVFNARWDDTKGGEDLIAAANQLIEAGADVWGLDWGNQASLARAVGVNLVPRLAKRQYHDFLESANVVVGQTGFGMLTISDLETLALGRPLVSLSTFEDAPVAQTEPDIAATVQRLLEDSSLSAGLGKQARSWVLANRHPIQAVRALDSLYSQILG